MMQCEIVAEKGLRGVLDRTLGTHDFVELPRIGEQIAVKYREERMNLSVIGVRHYPSGISGLVDEPAVIVIVGWPLAETE